MIEIIAWGWLFATVWIFNYPEKFFGIFDLNGVRQTGGRRK